jgi:hypothetical protein
MVVDGRGLSIGYWHDGDDGTGWCSPNGGIGWTPFRSRDCGYNINRGTWQSACAHKLFYATPFSLFTACTAEPMFTQSRRTKFGARPFANRVQLCEWARILREANSQNQIKQPVPPHLRPSRVGRSRVGIIWDNEIFTPEQLDVQRVVD